MKILNYAPAVAGGVLGFLFIASGLVVLLHLAPMPQLPEGSPPALFMAAFGGLVSRRTSSAASVASSGNS